MHLSYSIAYITWKYCYISSWVKVPLATLLYRERLSAVWCLHDDVMTRKGFSHYWPFEDFPHRGKCGALVFSLMLSRTSCWTSSHCNSVVHYDDVVMGTMASQITSLMIVYSTVYSTADQRKHQSSALLAFFAGNSPWTGEFPAQRASNAENVSIYDVIM